MTVCFAPGKSSRFGNGFTALKAIVLIVVAGGAESLVVEADGAGEQTQLLTEVVDGVQLLGRCRQFEL